MQHPACATSWCARATKSRWTLPPALHLHVDDAELTLRRAVWTPPPAHAARGYVKRYVDHVLQANEGVDLDFLVGRTGSPVPRDNH